MRPLVLLLAAACAGDPPSAPPAAPPSAVGEGLREAEILAEGLPEAATPYATALAKVAAELGVGVVRCPLSGGGKANARFGTPRDQVPRVGPMLLLEVDPDSDPPWDPLFDTVIAEDEWLTMLAVPGATTGWFATRKRVFEFDYPAPAPGETVSCTAVRQVPFRTVKGKVDLAGTTGRAFAVPCLADPPPIGEDGTFVLDLPVPCTLWVEVENRQSNRFRIDPGDEPFDRAFVLGPPDQLQGPDRKFTEKGKAVALAHLATVVEQHDATAALIARVAASFPDDPAAVKVADQWKYDLWEWKIRIDAARNILERPADAPPPPAKLH